MDQPVLLPETTPVAGTPVPAPAADAAPAPAPRPARGWVHELLWQAVAIAVTCGLLVGGLRLDKADFHAPFTYEYDVLLILPFVKATVERGSHWRNERLGAPGIQELHDFPVVDHLHFAVIWLLGKLLADPVVVFNAFHLLTYPLTTATTMFVLRRFGLSVPAAMAGGILFAFQPYHYLRGQMHYFLAAYYVIPLTMMVTLWVCQGRLPFFRRSPDGRYRFTLLTWDTLAAVLIAAATSSAGAYYAYFACGLLVLAGAYGWAAGTWRAAAAAAGVIAVVVAGGVANHVPTFLYQRANGQNARPTFRMAEDSERYGMRIAQLIFPVAQHNPIGYADKILLDPAAVRSKYQSPQFKELNEADWDPLGLIGTVGYLYLLAVTVLPGRRGWPIGPLAALALFATLVGTLGGLGAVFNYLVSPQVRCYNRISIDIAFLAVFAAVWLVDRFFDGRAGWGRRLRWPAFLFLTLFGIWDQTNEQWFPDLRIRQPGYVGVDDAREQVAKRFWEDRAFFERVEALLPNGAVFTYPYIEYPESQPYQETGKTEKIESYDHVLGYLHTKTLRWSFGAMKGREWDTWQREVSGRDPIPRFLERLVLTGFDGLLVDSRGLNPTRFHHLKEGIEQYLGHGALREFYPGRRLYLFDLRGYRDALRGSFGAAPFEAMAKAEREGLTVLWLKGFASYEPSGYENRSHWCGAGGQLVFLNRSDKPVAVTARMEFRTIFKDTARLRVDGGAVWTDEFEIGPEDKPPTYTRELVIPPGWHKVTVRCTPSVGVLPNDSRSELFTVNNFKLTPAER